MRFPSGSSARVMGRALAACLALAVVTAAAAKAPGPPPVPAPDWPSGCEPDRMREDLAGADSADVSRACGNLRLPWAYRGPLGRGTALHFYGRREADPAWVARVASMLLDSAGVDTIYRAPGAEVSCEHTKPAPVYLVRFRHAGRTTNVLVRFDLGAALVFASNEPLGLLRLGARADSLWAMLAEPLFDDPQLRQPPPHATDSLFDRAHALGDTVIADVPPHQLARATHMPDYPEEAQRRGIEGTVFVLTRVGVDGAVHDAVVHAGPVLLQDVALETVWNMRFSPAKSHGTKVEVWTMVPVTYHAH